MVKLQLMNIYQQYIVIICLNIVLFKIIHIFFNFQFHYINYVYYIAVTN